MASVLHRTTKELRHSVHTPDYSTVDWIVNPRDVEALRAIPRRYRIIEGDDWREADAGEKAAIDAAIATALRAEQKQEAKDTYLRDVMAAMAELTRKQFNVLRSRMVPTLPDITVQQMRDAIEAEIDARA